MKNSFAFALLLLCFSASDCKKPKNVVVYDFTWPANPTIDDDVVFTSNAPAGSTFLWNFGDGGTSTYPVGAHYYDSAGNYTVSLVVNGADQHPIIKSVSIGPSPKFFYNGSPCAGDTMYFYSNVLPGSTFLWDFGDGATSTLSTPYHIYADTGTFVVKLNINKRAAYVPCDAPKITIQKDPIYTHLINGTRMMHHTAYSTHFNSTYVVSDTSFVFKCVDQITVSANSSTLKFEYSKSADSILVFHAGIPTGGIGLAGQSRIYLYFNRYTGGLSYTSQRWVGSAMGDYTLDSYTSF